MFFFLFLGLFSSNNYIFVILEELDQNGGTEWWGAWWRLGLGGLKLGVGLGSEDRGLL